MPIPDNTVRSALSLQQQRYYFVIIKIVHKIHKKISQEKKKQ